MEAGLYNVVWELSLWSCLAEDGGRAVQCGMGIKSVVLSGMGSLQCVPALVGIRVGTFDFLPL